MVRYLGFCVIFMIVFFAAGAGAEDKVIYVPVKQALSGKVAKAKLLKYVPVYMKGQGHPGVEKRYREYKSNKRTSGAGHSPQEACNIAFVSALIALQERADREGGNAVVDIYSMTRNDRYQNGDKFACTTGNVMANVVLRGTVVQIAD